MVGLGYNSLWERGGRRFGYWAARFDRQARALLRTLRRRGARQIVWVTLRQPTAGLVPPAGLGQVRRSSSYFPWVNQRLRGLARRRRDLVLADWRKASDRRGLTYDAIHVNTMGAGVMDRTICARCGARPVARPSAAAPSACVHGAREVATADP